VFWAGHAYDAAMKCRPDPAGASGGERGAPLSPKVHEPQPRWRQGCRGAGRTRPVVSFRDHVCPFRIGLASARTAA